MLLFVQPSETEQKTKGGRGSLACASLNRAERPCFCFKLLRSALDIVCVRYTHTLERERDNEKIQDRQAERV